MTNPKKIHHLTILNKNRYHLSILKRVFGLSMSGVQNVHGPTIMMEQRYKVNIRTSIKKEKSFQISLLSCHALLEKADPKTLKK